MPRFCLASAGFISGGLRIQACTAVLLKKNGSLLPPNSAPPGSPGSATFAGSPGLDGSAGSAGEYRL